MADRAASDILIASTRLQLSFKLQFEDGITREVKDLAKYLNRLRILVRGVKVIGSSD
jgi:hypothetical protein